VGLVSRLRSSSYVASLSAPRRDELERRLRERLAPGPVALRYVTVVYVARLSRSACTPSRSP